LASWLIGRRRLVDRIHSARALCRDSGPTADLDDATFDRLFAADVRAPYFLVGALAP